MFDLTSFFDCFNQFAILKSSTPLNVILAVTEGLFGGPLHKNVVCKFPLVTVKASPKTACHKMQYVICK